MRTLKVTQRVIDVTKHRRNGTGTHYISAVMVGG